MNYCFQKTLLYVSSCLCEKQLYWLNTFSGLDRRLRRGDLKMLMKSSYQMMVTCFQRAWLQIFLLCHVYVFKQTTFQYKLQLLILFALVDHVHSTYAFKQMTLVPIFMHIVTTFGLQRKDMVMKTKTYTGEDKNWENFVLQTAPLKGVLPGVIRKLILE